MVADRADFRGLLADNDVTAVCALPDHITFAGEDEAFLDIGKELAIAFFVIFFDLADHFEQGGDPREAFFPCGLGEAIVHIGPFVVFAVSGSFEVGDGVGNFASVQQLEPDLRVFFFISGGFFENGSDLVVPFLLGFGSKIGVFVPGLGLTGESGLQVGFSLCTFDVLHNTFLLRNIVSFSVYSEGGFLLSIVTNILNNGEK